MSYTTADDSICERLKSRTVEEFSWPTGSHEFYSWCLNHSKMVVDTQTFSLARLPPIPILTRSIS